MANMQRYETEEGPVQKRHEEDDSEHRVRRAIEFASDRLDQAEYQYHLLADRISCVLDPDSTVSELRKSDPEDALELVNALHSLGARCDVLAEMMGSARRRCAL